MIQFSNFKKYDNLNTSTILKTYNNPIFDEVYTCEKYFAVDWPLNSSFSTEKMTLNRLAHSNFPFNFNLVVFSGFSLSIHTFRHLTHQDMTIFKHRGSKTVIFDYLEEYFNFTRNNVIFHNDAIGCTNRCFQFLKAENVYYKGQ